MRRFVMTAVAITVIITSGVSFGDQDAPSKMPPNVRQFLDKLVGTWTFDGTGQGKYECQWNPGKNVVVGQGKFQIEDVIGSGSDQFYWDGVSEDGIIASWSGSTNEGFHHGGLRGKVLSKTRLVAEKTALRVGKKVKARIQIDFTGQDQYIWKETNLSVGGEGQPDETWVFTRVKGTGDKYKVLEHMAGHWTWEGEQVDINVDSSPYGPGGRFAGSSTLQLVLDGKYLLGKFQEKSPVGKMSQGIGVVGYNAEKECYVAYDFLGDGSVAVNTFTVTGRAHKGKIDITTRTGEKLLARFVNKYAPDWKSFDSTWEVSLDNGRTWSHWAKYRSEKSDNTGTKDAGDKQVDVGEVEVVDMGRQWSKPEMEIWDTVKAYWNVGTIDGLMAYIHPEFMGWPTEEPMPNNRAATRLWLANLFHTRKFEITTITPTGLKIHGNVAIVNYYYSQAYRDTEGKQQIEQGRFTDILMKEKGKWLLIGDHGGPTPTSE